MAHGLPLPLDFRGGTAHGLPHGAYSNLLTLTLMSAGQLGGRRFDGAGSGQPLGSDPPASGAGEVFPSGD